MIKINCDSLLFFFDKCRKLTSGILRLVNIKLEAENKKVKKLEISTNPEFNFSISPE
jgi:hypothetical protein